MRRNAEADKWRSIDGEIIRVHTNDEGGNPGHKLKFN